MTSEKLCELAMEAMNHAYVPYSGYKVGAALLCADGSVYQGCNIENAAYGQGRVGVSLQQDLRYHGSCGGFAVGSADGDGSLIV